MWRGRRSPSAPHCVKRPCPSPPGRPAENRPLRYGREATVDLQRDLALALDESTAAALDDPPDGAGELVEPDPGPVALDLRVARAPGAGQRRQRVIVRDTPGQQDRTAPTPNYTRSLHDGP